MTETTQFRKWIDRLSAEMKADRKKATILIVLIAVGAVFGTRLVVNAISPEKPVPAKAAATPVKTSGLVTQTPTVPQPLDPKAEARLSEYLAKVNREISRDLFVAKLELFPRVSSELADATTKPGDSMSSMIREPILGEGKLKLQSTMVGNTPNAVINNRVVQTNQIIDGFTVLLITERSCVVEKDGVRATLYLPQE